MSQSLQSIVNLQSHPLPDPSYQQQCKSELDAHGVLLMPDFLTGSAIDSILVDGDSNRDLAYFTASDHNVYLAPTDPDFADDHPRNRCITSSKGCITTDQIPATSDLRPLYDSDVFRQFLCKVLNEKQLHEYADPLSSINLHYASEGQELGWHFDNSSFAITLLIRRPLDGAHFEYVKNARDADAGDMNYDGVKKILNGDVPVERLNMNAGDLVLFRGRNSIHRVTPTIGDITRMLVVLAYNTEPGVSLSESARMTFYGRLN